MSYESYTSFRNLQTELQGKRSKDQGNKTVRTVQTDHDAAEIEVHISGLDDITGTHRGRYIYTVYVVVAILSAGTTTINGNANARLKRARHVSWQ